MAVAEIKKEDVSPTPEALQMETANQFLSALFCPEDLVIFRPIESWTEGGKKKNRVSYRRTSHHKISPNRNRFLSLYWNREVEEEYLNLYFGVCPRFGRAGQFDLAWQIRKVVALWTDIDHISTEQALQRVEAAQLPQPSIFVNSGNGAHLYWLLDVPFIIEADVPPAVQDEWIELPTGKKKPRKFIVQDGERLYLDKHKHLSKLSTSAHDIQDILAGIANRIGGDHTTDLSRLLRLPGSMNRKDQRNGKPPVPTELVRCDPCIRYPLSLFEPFKVVSATTQRAQNVLAMPLPKVRKPTNGKQDRLSLLIAASEIANSGNRSEADFAVCCFAIENGFDAESVWSQVQNVGKFAEGGQRYFDLTWKSASHNTQEISLDKILNQKSTKKDRAPSSDADDSSANGSSRQVITIDESFSFVADTLHAVTDCMVSTGNCFRRADQTVAIHDDKILSILNSAELAGLLSQFVEFCFSKDDESEYKPFPSTYANTWLNNHVELSRLPLIKAYVHNPVYSEDWRLIAPGFDKETGIYYSGTEIEPRSDTKHIDALLGDFCFKTPGDRTNYIGMMVTMVLIPRFIGSKPATLFCANQAGLGKTILAQIFSLLRDGKRCETISYNPNDEEFEKRLGAHVRRGHTTIIIDNAKSNGRNPKIESACLERSITDPILSFRLLGASDTIRTENSHFLCITANSPEVSRDLVSRSLVVNLNFEGDPSRRTFAIDDPEGYALTHRNEILGELLGLVERWKAAGSALAKTNTRFNKQGWGNIVGGILAVAGQPEFLSNAEEAAAQLDETKRDFAELVDVLADHPQGTWTPAELVEQCAVHKLLADAIGQGSAKSKTTRMGTVAGRFVNEAFKFDDDRIFTFIREPARKCNVYRVADTQKSAEP